MREPSNTERKNAIMNYHRGYQDVTELLDGNHPACFNEIVIIIVAIKMLIARWR